MGEIFFRGDVHDNFRHIIEAMHKHAPAAVVLLGDIQAQRPLKLGGSDIVTAQMNGKVAFAMRFYNVGDLAVNVISPRPRKHRQGLDVA